MAKQWKVWDIRSGKVGLLPYLKSALEQCIQASRDGKQVVKVISAPDDVVDHFVISDRPKLFLQLEGRNHVTHPNGETIVEPGEILIIQAKTPHREERLFHRKRYAHIYTNLTAQRYAYNAYARCGDPSQKQYNFASSYIDNNKNAFVLQMLNELCENASRAPSETQALCQSLLHAIMLQLVIILQHPKGHESGHPHIHHCKQLIHEHLQDPNLSVPLLAEYMNIHPDYLSRVFSQYGEQRLVPYISDCRINLAKEILRNLNVTIDEVSALCGFSERSYFTKVFRRHTGKTPTQYRQGVNYIKTSPRF